MMVSVCGKHLSCISYVAVVNCFQTPSLVHLEARGCLLVESNVGFLSRPIRMGCFLKVLHLENTNMSGKSLLILGK